MEADIKLCEELLAMDSFNVKGERFRPPFATLRLNTRVASKK